MERSAKYLKKIFCSDINPIRDLLYTLWCDITSLRYALRAFSRFISYRVYRKANISHLPTGKYIALQNNISQKRRLKAVFFHLLYPHSHSLILSGKISPQPIQRQEPSGMSDGISSSFCSNFLSFISAFLSFLCSTKGVISIFSLFLVKVKRKRLI